MDAATENPQTGIGTVRYPITEPSDAECTAKLQKRALTTSITNAPPGSHAHDKLDAAVAAAYG